MIWRNPVFSIRELPEPEIGPDEVLIRVRACGICGSDVHRARRHRARVLGRGRRGRQGRRRPLRPGDPVCAEEIAWCGACFARRSGHLNSCERLGELGFTFDGAHAELVATKAKYCWPIDGLVERLGEERGNLAGAFVEPTSVSYIGMFVQSRGSLTGSHVGVAGAGPIGLAAVGLACAAGAGTVLVFEPSARASERSRGGEGDGRAVSVPARRPPCHQLCTGKTVAGLTRGRSSALPAPCHAR